MDDFNRINELKKEGRELMTINLFGTTVVPVPLGKCEDCANFVNDCCELGEKKENECKKVVNGMKFFAPRKG